MSTGVVLAAGSSRRLGTPKQLLPFGDTTVLGATLKLARACPFDQLIVVLGGAAAEVRAAVDLDGVEVVVAEDHASGCSSSLRVALDKVHKTAAGIVLLLGDQPGVAVSTVEDLLTHALASSIAVCRYRDGVGHPFWLGRSVFTEPVLAHGDKGVSRLLQSGQQPVVEVRIDADIPLDVDTWADYRRLLASVPP